MAVAEGRFQREILLIGEEGYEKLRSSHVAVFGAGGVGSFCVEALARAGIGELTIIDSDIVQESNINRQLIATTETLSRPKVDVMAERVLSINPDAKVHPVKAWLCAENADELVQAEYVHVADAIDSLDSKVLLITTCLRKEIPVTSSMGAGNKLDASSFRIADISDTRTCPLAKAVRTKLRKEGVLKGVTAVFSDTEPIIKSPGPPSSISFVPPVAGMLLAQAVIRRILGMSPS